MENLPPSSLALLSVTARRSLSRDVVRKAATDFADEYLNNAAVFNSMNEIVTEVIYEALPDLIQEAQQELDWKEILDEIVSCVLEQEAKAVVLSALRECHIDIFKLQEQEVATSAAKQLIDIFLLECAVGKMTLQASVFSGKEYSGTVLDSLMLGILLQQFFSIQQHQRATSENIPLGDFHLKAFTKVALDVILTELNKVIEEDMEDLLEYEREVELERMREAEGRLSYTHFRE